MPVGVVRGAGGGVGEDGVGEDDEAVALRTGRAREVRVCGGVGVVAVRVVELCELVEAGFAVRGFARVVEDVVGGRGGGGGPVVGLRLVGAVVGEAFRGGAREASWTECLGEGVARDVVEEHGRGGQESGPGRGIEDIVEASRKAKKDMKRMSLRGFEDIAGWMGMEVPVWWFSWVGHPDPLCRGIRYRPSCVKCGEREAALAPPCVASALVTCHLSWHVAILPKHSCL